MFDRYMTAKQAQRPRWVGMTITFSLLAHVLGGLALVGFSFWKIERLETDRNVVLEFPALAAPPAEQQAAPPGDPQVRKLIVPDKDVVQPARVKQVAIVDPTGGAGGDKGKPNPNGGGGGNGDLDSTGTCIGPDCTTDKVADPQPCTHDCEPPKPAPVTDIPQAMIEGQRTAGDEQIHAPSSVIRDATDKGVDTIRAQMKLCLDERGVPSSITVRKSSGYPELDEKLVREMSKWRYRPYAVSGEAVPVCFLVPFKYIITK